MIPSPVGTEVDFVSASLSRLHEDDTDSSSGSSGEDEPTSTQLRRSSLLAQQQQQQQQQQQHHQRRQSGAQNTLAEGDADDEETDDDHVGTLNTVGQSQSLVGRPQSSMSSQRYRTPMGGSIIMSPPPGTQTNTMQMSLGQAVPLSQQQQHVASPGVHISHSAHSAHSASAYQQGMHAYPYGHTGHQSSSPLRPGSVPMQVPNVQPMPAYETPSAFEGPSPPASSTMALHTSTDTTMGSSLTSPYVNVNPHPYPAAMYPGHPSYRGPLPQPSSSSASASHNHGHTQSQQQIVSGSGGPISMASSGANVVRSPIERAVESVQAHLAALQERIEALEARSMVRSNSQHSLFGGLGNIVRGSPSGSGHVWASGSGYGHGRDDSWWWNWDPEYFDREHMGLWSVALVPLARLTRFLLRVLAFLIQRDPRTGFGGPGQIMSPGQLVLRRLLLDASFLVCAAVVARLGWRRSGARRREVVRALRGLWGALAGRPMDRVLVERGV